MVGNILQAVDGSEVLLSALSRRRGKYFLGCRERYLLSRQPFFFDAKSEESYANEVSSKSSPLRTAYEESLSDLATHVQRRPPTLLI